MPTDQLSLAQARRINLAAQGFAEPRPQGRVDRRHLRRVLDRIGLIQIDSVNVLVRSQELPLFARLGDHPRSLIHDASQDGELFEYWVHEASHVDTRHYHLYRWKMRRGVRWKAFEELLERRPDLVRDVYQRIVDHGGVVSGELSERSGPKGSWWDWDDAKIALEALFHEGKLGARRRVSDFARVYDLTERLIPTEALNRPEPSEAEARKELLTLAARHHGVGTIDDLCDYHRQKLTPCKPLAEELVEDGVLRKVQVEGWAKPAYVHRDARVPRTVDRCALLSPFDPVVWQRDRTERLYDFRYRIEIYTPQARRVFGYYVLPVLVGDRLVGRLDMKAERSAGELLVRAAHTEAHAEPRDWAEAAAGELARMARWLGLDRVTVERRGDAADALAAAVAGAASNP